MVEGGEEILAELRSWLKLSFSIKLSRRIIMKNFFTANEISLDINHPNKISKKPKNMFGNALITDVAYSKNESSTISLK